MEYSYFFNFPLINKYSGSLSQALKIGEEYGEFLQALNAGDKEHAIIELLDIVQAIETYLCNEYMDDEIKAAYIAVHNKNWERGYYDN